MMLMKKIFVAATLAMVTAGGVIADGPVVGKEAPAFTLTDMSGKSVSLADYAGKPVMLEWTNHGCPYVQKHYNSGNMQKTQRALTEDGVIWLSVISSAPGKQGHVDGAGAEKLTTSRGAYPTTVLLDPTGEVGKLYNARTTPQMFMISGDGTLTYQGAIDDKPSANPKSLEGATNYALAAHAALKAGKPMDPSSTKPYGCGVKY